jgi:hypothetical protein
MAENAVAYSYPHDPNSVARAPVLLDMLPTQSREINISNNRKASGLTLRILNYLYPQADLDAMGEGFMATCTEEESGKLVKGFIETTTRVIEMIPVDMS